MRLTEQQAIYFLEKLSGLEQEMQAAGQTTAAADRKIYSLTTVFTPTVRKDLNETEDAE